MVFPFFFLMSFLVFLGSMLSISSCSWFGVWSGLELNMLCFLPIVMNFSSFMGVESVVKYFLIQSFGSVGVLMGGLFEDSFIFHFFDFFFFFLCLSLFLKVGVFPFHWWLPGVLSGLNWLGVIFLSTWQKLAPILVFSSFGSCGFFFLLICVFSSFVGGVSGIGQTSVRTILAFSSIGHAGWIFSLFCVSWFFGFVYFFIYFISTFFLVFFFWCMDYYRVSQVFSFSLINCFFFYLRSFCIWYSSFFGVFSKLFGFIAFSSLSFGFFFLLILILGSLFSLYFYLGLFFTCFFFFFTFLENIQSKFYLLLFFSLFSIFVSFSIFLLIIFFIC
uniref:NADH-ubiquinone oxidoreductase chain 2 n=1 Tax=Paranemertes cf. peregrina SCS-2010 TaxID=743461 RepID=E7C1A5_9BILA|nr:NADH dehydrogenase subunit 2 [Paranemertes cf. peregrina SCS-2010]ADD62165.1 NADH dehydrogenase subunit 2 [Paranemertes cf. peregrina SCS-2010]